MGLIFDQPLSTKRLNGHTQNRPQMVMPHVAVSFTHTVTERKLMSDIYDEISSNPSTTPPSTSASGKADAAKEQAGQLKDTALDSGAQVAGTAKTEAGKVVGEAKTQAKDLFSQTQSELKDQAGAQQQRVAAGLRSVSDELGSMANSSEGGGVAADLVQQAASRAGSVATWLEGRDPGSLLSDVRAYASRKPGTFIAVAAIAGLVAGRLTKNLVSSASDEKKAAEATDQAAPAAPSAPAFVPVETTYVAPVDYTVTETGTTAAPPSFDDIVAPAESEFDTYRGDRA